MAFRWCLNASLCADQQVDGRVGPQPVVLDHTSGFEGLLFVDDDLLGVRLIIRLAQNPACAWVTFLSENVLVLQVIGHSNFSSIRATTCVYKGEFDVDYTCSSGTP